VLGGKARAVLHGRVHVTTDDIKQVAYPVLRHRIMTTFHADAEGITTDDIVKKLIESVPVPLDGRRV
jgi:MoxR-like ATPase